MLTSQKLELQFSLKVMVKSGLEKLFWNSPIQNFAKNYKFTITKLPSYHIEGFQKREEIGIFLKI